jgi:hypothetical protein
MKLFDGYRILQDQIRSAFPEGPARDRAMWYTLRGYAAGLTMACDILHTEGQGDPDKLLDIFQVLNKHVAEMADEFIKKFGQK